MNIKQGARSTVEFVNVDGVLCVQKRYNERNNPPIVKLNKERAFYEYYDGLEVIPKLVSWKEPDTIVVEYCEGDRAIDLIRDEDKALDIEGFSRDYGEKAYAFFEWPLSESASEKEEARTTIISVIERVQAAIEEDIRYQIPVIERSAEGLYRLLEIEGYWAAPMMCKYDGSGANLLVKGDRLVSIIDFDTSYMGSRLTFLGSLVKDCLHLDWRFVRAGLAHKGLPFPNADLLAVGAHFNVWQVYLDSFRDGRFGWAVEAVRSRILELSDQASQS